MVMVPTGSKNVWDWAAGGGSLLWNINDPKDTPSDPPDDEFDQGAGGLDGKWTVIDGAPGVCSLFYGGGDRYDLATWEGRLLIQVDNGNNVKLRQDYTLADGASIILAVAPALMADAESGIVNNEIQVGICLNTNDPDYDGDYVRCEFDTSVEGWRIRGYGLTAPYSTPGAGGNICSGPVTEKLYLCIARDGLDYYAMWSSDGEAWFVFAKQTFLAQTTNVWIYVVSLAAFGNPTPMQIVDWIRLGDNNPKPW